MSILPLIIFVLYYGLGAYWIFFIEKKKQSNNKVFLQGAWLLFSIGLYASVLELMKGSAYFLIPSLFFIFFLWSYFKKRARLLNGLFFQIFLVTLGIYLLYNFYITRDLLIVGLFVVAFILFFLIAIFGAFSLLVFLYWNSFVILKKESRSLANMLTLFLAILLTIYFALSFIINHTSLWYINTIYMFLSFILFYFFTLLVIFLTSALLYQFYKPAYNQDFIIILGAGLIDGERVTPLLAKRIDRAISFGQTQKVKTAHPLKFVMSGGQGADERVPEAIAMKNYALEQGCDPDLILIESNSTTTYQNMTFSKEVIDTQAIANPKILFSSNNYHIFRAAIFANQAGFKAEGIGAHTAFYYLPNAFLREFAAILMMHRNTHIAVVCFAIFYTAISTLIQIFS